MITFSKLRASAELHKGGAKYVSSQLPIVSSNAELEAHSDAYYLSTMSRRIFRAGLKHELVDKKWPAFEKAFHGFNPFDVLMMGDDEVEAQMKNSDIIRHWGKIRSIRTNAAMVKALSDEYDGFGRFLTQWPGDDITGLWLLLKKRGAQLGGLSAQRFLRMVGKDTFVLTDDVVSVLMAQGILTKKPTAQRDIKAAQAAFNQWQRESGLPLSHISRIVSFTTNAA